MFYEKRGNLYVLRCLSKMETAIQAITTRDLKFSCARLGHVSRSKHKGSQNESIE